jgi:hypothetical protein
MRRASRHTLRDERLIRVWGSLAERASQILSGDFNIDFQTEKSKPLIDFLKNSVRFKYVK